MDASETPRATWFHVLVSSLGGTAALILALVSWLVDDMPPALRIVLWLVVAVLSLHSVRAHGPKAVVKKIALAAVILIVVAVLGWRNVREALQPKPSLPTANEIAEAVVERIPADKPRVAVSIDCPMVTLPIVIAKQQRTLFALDVFPSLFGGLTQYMFSAESDDARWPSPAAFGAAYQCEVSNHGTVALLNIDLPIRLDFLRMVDGQARHDDVEITRSRLVEIPSLPIGREPFVFYVRNQGPQVVLATLSTHVDLQLPDQQTKQQAALVRSGRAATSLILGPKSPDRRAEPLPVYRFTDPGQYPNGHNDPNWFPLSSYRLTLDWNNLDGIDAYAELRVWPRDCGSARVRVFDETTDAVAVEGDWVHSPYKSNNYEYDCKPVFQRLKLPRARGKHRYALHVSAGGGATATAAGEIVLERQTR